MIQIRGSVGHDGLNRFEDVATVQTLLNDNLFRLTPLRPLEPDGKIGPITIAAIEEFQRRVLRMARPDGRVDAGGRTLHTLVAGRREALVFRVGVLPIASAVRFPLASRPAKSYKEGMRRFGAGRKKGRLHAGCDLYAPVGTQIYAMADGEVIRDVYAFYLGTYALEIRHPEFLARYGEIGSAAAGLKKGSKITRGEEIARVGELRGLNLSMVHLELYSGKASGRLTLPSNKPYQRRADLIDPTSILDAAVLR